MAYGAFACVIAAAVYLLATRCMDAPFHDSLSAEQRAILDESCRSRKIVFCAGLLAGALVLCIAKPIRLPCAKREAS